MGFILLCAVAAILISKASLGVSQAPGDFESRCDNQINYPSEWKVLFDSNRYERVSPTLEIKDFDSDSQTLSPVGGICTPALFSCGTPPQNNWIFSQLIHTLSAEEIFINVSLNDCYSASCTDLITFHLNSSEVASSSARIDPTKYSSLRYSTINEGSIETLVSSFQPKKNGFYFGLHDEGFCGIVGRIIMYHRVCPARRVGLISYPETTLPPTSGSVKYLEASCANNAHNVSSLVFKADPVSGTCTDISQMSCECNLGYFQNNDICQPCKIGTFGVQGGRCMDCPSNSVSTTNASISCQCQPGFYRTATESSSQPCTAPPQAVENLQAVAEDTSVALTWTRPASRGRSDVYYSIAISDPSNLGTLITISSHFESSSSSRILNFNINNLFPDTSYEVRVTTHNGVSDQDLASVSSRTESVFVRTKQGAPGIPALHRFCNVIVWSPPNVTGGMLTGYDLMIGSMMSKHFDPNKNFYVTSEADKTANVVVQIRANNAALSGPWSEPQAIGCENQLTCNNIVEKISPDATSDVPATSAPPPSFTAPSATTKLANPSTASAPPTTASAPPTTASAPPTTASAPPTTAPAPPPTLPSTQQPQALWSCLTPPTPSNGQVSVLESIAKYSCNDGYILQGSKERVCTIVGWSGTDPSCIRQCKVDSPHFFLNGVQYRNNSQVKLENVGEGDQALQCQTSSSNCCRGDVRIGEFYYPSGQVVGINANGESFYRNRRDGEILLNRQPQSSGPLGMFRCEIPDGCDEKVSLYITLT